MPLIIPAIALLIMVDLVLTGAALALIVQELRGA